MRMMNKVLALLLGMVILLNIAGCSDEEREITCDQVIAAYEEAGYEIFHKEAADGEQDYVCYVRATDPQSGEYIFFHFFYSTEAAESYADEQEWNPVLWLYSLVSAEPTWLTTKTYNTIEIEYDNGDLYKPFQTLLE